MSVLNYVLWLDAILLTLLAILVFGIVVWIIVDIFKTKNKEKT